MIFAADWNLKDLADLERRADAQMNGLKLSGNDGITLARPFLRGREPGAATAATMVFMAAGRSELDQEVLRRSRKRNHPPRAASARACVIQTRTASWRISGGSRRPPIR